MIFIKRFNNINKNSIKLFNNYYNNINKCLYTTQQQKQQPNNKLLNILNNNNKNKNKLNYLNEIKENPNNSKALFNLAINLEPNELIKIENSDGTIKEELNRKSIYLKLLNLPINNENQIEISNSYNNLAYQFNKENQIQLLNGEKLTNKQLFLKSIEINPNNSSAYNNLANSLSSSNKETIKIGDKEFTKKELYLKSIELDSKYSKAYHNLANSLEPNEIITLNDGNTKMSAKDLYLKSIDLQPYGNNSSSVDNDSGTSSYFNLAILLSETNESIQLLNGTRMTEKDLYLKDIDINSNSKNISYSFNNLANLMPTPTKLEQQQQHQLVVTLLDGRQLSKKMLYCKAIEIDGNNIEAYNNLVILLKDLNDSVPLNGKQCSKLDLLLKLIQLDSNNPNYYYNLSLNLSKANKIQQKIKLLNDNKEMNSIDLVLKAIDLNPKEPLFFKLLSKLLDLNKFGTITLLNGKLIKNSDIKIKFGLNDNNNNNDDNNNNIFSVFKKLFK